MHQCLRPKTRTKKRDIGDVLGQKLGPDWTGCTKPLLGTKIHCPNVLMMILQDFTEKWLLEH